MSHISLIIEIMTTALMRSNSGRTSLTSTSLYFAQREASAAIERSCCAA